MLGGRGKLRQRLARVGDRRRFHQLRGEATATAQNSSLVLLAVQFLGLFKAILQLLSQDADIGFLKHSMVAANDVEARDDVVAAEMAIPVNKEIHLLMHAKDVGHSFYVRELRIQQDFVPGLDLSLHFTATKIGKYEIVCTQLCGLGHYNMKAYLNVLSQEDFDKWMKEKISEQ